MLSLPHVEPEETGALWRSFWSWFDNWTMMSFNPRIYHQGKR
jgi:hypothetical protein